jgi:hypothetical protein
MLLKKNWKMEKHIYMQLFWNCSICFSTIEQKKVLVKMLILDTFNICLIDHKFIPFKLFIVVECFRPLIINNDNDNDNLINYTGVFFTSFYLI